MMSRQPEQVSNTRTGRMSAEKMPASALGPSPPVHGPTHKRALKHSAARSQKALPRAPMPSHGT